MLPLQMVTNWFVYLTYTSTRLILLRPAPFNRRLDDHRGTMLKIERSCFFYYNHTTGKFAAPLVRVESPLVNHPLRVWNLDMIRTQRRKNRVVDVGAQTHLAVVDIA